VTPRRTVQVAVALVVLQLAFRAWATWTSWFTGDDFWFIAHMTTIMMGAINGTAALLGVKIEANEPIHTAVRREQPVA